MSQHHTSKWIRADKRLAIYLRDGFCCAYCEANLESKDHAPLTAEELRKYHAATTGACPDCGGRQYPGHSRECPGPPSGPHDPDRRA